MKTVVALLLSCVFSLCFCSKGSNGSTRADILLYRYLKNRLRWAGEPDVRPVPANNLKAATKLGLNFSLMEILEMEKNGEIEMMTYMQMGWDDPNLTWEPSKFGGITNMRFPSQKVWRPDIRLYNNRATKVDLDPDSMIVVSSNGSILWVPMTKLESTCNKAGEEWTCNWKLGSWTYHGEQVTFKSAANLDMSTFKVNSQLGLNVTQVSSKVNKTKYACCPETYESLDIAFKVVKV